MKSSKIKFLFLAAVGVVILDIILRFFVNDKHRQEELRYWLEYQAQKLGLSDVKFQRL